MIFHRLKSHFHVNKNFDPLHKQYKQFRLMFSPQKIRIIENQFGPNPTHPPQWKITLMENRVIKPSLNQNEHDMKIEQDLKRKLHSQLCGIILLPTFFFEKVGLIKNFVRPTISLSSQSLPLNQSRINLLEIVVQII